VIAFAELGYSAFSALVVVVFLIPLQVFMGKIKSKIGLKNTMATSTRVHIMTEILTAIKLIKFYAWEEPFYERISAIRTRELNLLKKNLIANSINFMIVFCAPVAIVLLTLLTYWLAGFNINPVIGFTIASVFNTLRYPLIMLPLAVSSMSGKKIIQLRINFLIIHYLLYTS
jgi:hypothetical protein